MSLEQDNKVNDYSEKSIRILKGLQPVKQRPGMYTLTDCPLHIIQEVIDNATDEVLANFANRIILTEHADGSIFRRRQRTRHSCRYSSGREGPCR